MRSAYRNFRTLGLDFGDVSFASLFFDNLVGESDKSFEFECGCRFAKVFRFRLEHWSGSTKSNLSLFFRRGDCLRGGFRPVLWVVVAEKSYI